MVQPGALVLLVDQREQQVLRRNRRGLSAVGDGLSAVAHNSEVEWRFLSRGLPVLVDDADTLGR